MGKMNLAYFSNNVFKLSMSSVKASIIPKQNCSLSKTVTKLKFRLLFYKPRGCTKALL